jgi:transposase
LISVEEWAEIRRLHKSQGMSIKAIARHLGVGRNTVRRALRRAGPPRYERPRSGRAVDAAEPGIRALLADVPDMPASVIAERVGWQGGMTSFRERVRELRPAYRPLDPVGRTEYRPGELAQWDIWIPPMRIPVAPGQAMSLPVWVGVSGYSRTIVARMIPSRGAHDVIAGHLACLVALGGVPRLGVYDGEAAIGRRRGQRIELTDAFQRFRGVLGMGAHICAPGEPEHKGLVERANGYMETSFLPGRRFSGIDDFNGQLGSWLVGANGRVHRVIRERPVDRLSADRAAMIGLPPQLPEVARRTTALIARDHWVRVDTCDYSVDPHAIGRRAEVAVDLDQVIVRVGDWEIARHRRSLAPHRTITDPAHEAARGRLQRRRMDAGRPEDPAERVAERDLADYDRLLGVGR